MFRFCNSLTFIDLGNFDAQNVISFSSMFSHCSSLVYVNLPYAKRGNKLLHMDYMFAFCTKLMGIDSFNIDNLNIKRIDDIPEYIITIIEKPE